MSPEQMIDIVISLVMGIALGMMIIDIEKLRRENKMLELPKRFRTDTKGSDALLKDVLSDLEEINEANDLHIAKDGEDVNKYCHLADIVDLIDDRLAKVEFYISEQEGKRTRAHQLILKKAVIKKKVGLPKGSKLVNGHFVMPTVK